VCVYMCERERERERERKKERERERELRQKGHTLCTCFGQKLRDPNQNQDCTYLKIRLLNHIYIYSLYMVLLAGKSPNIRFWPTLHCICRLKIEVYSMQTYPAVFHARWQRTSSIAIVSHIIKCSNCKPHYKLQQRKKSKLKSLHYC